MKKADKEMQILKQVIKEFVTKAPHFPEESEIAGRLGIAIANVEIAIREDKQC